MFKVKYEQINTIKPWMILGNNDWPYLLGAIVSIPILLWGTIGSFLRKNWFSFAYLAVATLLFAYIVPKFIKVRRMIISRFGSDNWVKEIVFNDSGIIITESGSKGVYTSTRRYEEIARVVEDKKDITLKMKTLPNIAFPKDRFCTGNWEECRRFIEERIV